MLHNELEEKFKNAIHHKVRQEKLNTRKIGIRNENPDYFSQRCLDPEDPKCNPEEFFKEISCSVELNDIYTVVGTSYVNDEWLRCPILLKINAKPVLDQYKGNQYLLQIWDIEKKVKVMEFSFKNIFRSWVQCKEYLVYLQDREGEYDDCLHILNLYEKESNKMLIKGIGLEPDSNPLAFQYSLAKHLMVKNNKIFSLSRTELRFAPLNLDFNSYSAAAYEVPKDKIRVIKPGCTMHGILLNQFADDDDCLIVAFETPDNQLDFNMLYAYDIENEGPLNYKWEQYRIVNPRNLSGPDPIKKICNVFYQGFNFCVSLRQSGGIDMYWNMARRDSPDVKIADIAMSIGAFYFKLADGSFTYFKHLGRSNISYSMCLPTTEEEITFDQPYLKTIMQYCKLYTGFKIIATYDDTFVAVSHNNFISIYSVETSRWVNHLYFPNRQVLGLFSRKSPYSNWITVDALTSENAFFYDVLADIERQEPFADPQLTLEGDRIHMNQDVDCENSYTIAMRVSGNHQFWRFKGGELQKENIAKNEYTFYERNVIPIQTSSKEMKDQDQRYFLVNNNYNVSIYQTGRESYYNSENMKKVKVIKDIYIPGDLHSVVSYDIKHHLFLFTCDQLYILFFEKGVKQPDPIELKSMAVQYFNKQVTYVLMKDDFLNIHTGLRLLDLESTMKKKTANPILLKNLDFGATHVLEHSRQCGRMGFLKSMTHIILAPYLHQNVNKLLGANENDSYLLSKRHSDRITTFSTDGKLTTWNVVTGKHICTHNKTEFMEELQGYYNHQKSDNLAIYYKYQNETNMKDEQFFDAWQLMTYAEKQATYMKRCDHQYRRWKIIEIKNEAEVNVLMEFTFPLFMQGTSVYLNDQRNRLILKIINYRTFIYQIHKYPGINNNEVYFELIRQIVDYPDEFESGNNFIASKFTFFSPCFTKYLKLDRKTNQFMIRNAITDETKLIPKDILFLPKKNTDEKIKETLNRVKFIDSATLLVVSEDGVEKMINIDSDFEEVGFNVRPLFNEINVKADDPQKENKEYTKHMYYFERESLENDDVLNRLKRKYQEYKSDYYLYKKKTFTDFYSSMLTVDSQSLYHFEHSFTFLHWSIIEQIQKKRLKVKDLEDSVIQALLYNILPGGNTVLHMLTSQEKELIRIFEEAHPGSEILYHIPFLPNFLGESPIHRCVEKQDFKSIDIILNYLRLYDCDHHSRCIKDQLGLFVKQKLPQYIDYIESRFIQTEQLKKFNKGGLRDDMTGLVTTELWFREEDFYRTVMDKEQMETRIKCEIMDLPGIYHYLDPDFQSFFDQLAITDNMNFFNSKAIQNLIDFNYPLCRNFILAFLFLPFCIFHVLFVVHANAIYEHRDETEGYKRANLAVSICLLIFSAYFIINELRQLFREGIEYIISVWNYIDLIGPIGVVFTTVITLIDFSGRDINETMLRCVYSVTTLFMWIKLLYFLRIFKKTGYLIRLIVEVLADMGIFLLVLLITVTAFGDAMLRLSLSNSPDNQFIQHSPADPPTVDEDGNEIYYEYKDLFFFAIAYTYRGILGDFDTSAFGQVATPLMWILWTLHTLFNMIVMLNLLISIIGDTYEKVIDIQVQAGYQEQARLIAENQHLIPVSFKRSYAAMGKYLVQVTDLEQNQDLVESKDPAINRLDQLLGKVEVIFQKVDIMEEKIATIKKKVDKQVPDEEEKEDNLNDDD